MRKLLRTIGQASVAELCLGGALLGLAGLGGWFSGWLDVVAAFAPLWLAMSALGAALAWPTLGPEMRRPALIAAAAGIVANLALMAPEFVRPIPRVTPSSVAAGGLGPPLTVLTFNAWDDNQDHNGTVDAILRANADVVLLQELNGLSVVGMQRLDAVYPYRGGCPAGCDLVMLSKRPWLVGGPTTSNVAGHDVSAIWGVTSAPDGRPFDVMTLHYAWPAPPAAQAFQRPLVAGIVAGLPKANLIVAGDFNLAPWTWALRRQDAAFAPLTRRERALFTWPAQIARMGRAAPLPLLPIDHLYAGAAWKTLAVRRLPLTGSDHYGMLVTLARDAPPEGR